MISIAFCTCRRESRIQWFLESLKAQGGFASDIEIIVVDFFGETKKAILEVFGMPEPSMPLAPGENLPAFIKVVAPKPSVWQGPNRLTKDNWFAASNSRNTAICHARGEFLVFCDDLSVLLPGWIDAVREAAQGNYCVYGAYRKCLGLTVENGVVKHFQDYQGGNDPRRAIGRVDRAVSCSSSILYGCSFGCPMEAYLDCNGFNEAADSLGGEDSLFGICLGKKGWPTMYDLRMGTLESEEDHHMEKPFIRRDHGVSPHDASHAILDTVMRGDGISPNYFQPGGIRALRQQILAGGEFPSDKNPQNFWWDGRLIAEMT